MSLTTKKQPQILIDMINYMNALTSRVKDFSLGSVARALLSAVAFQVDELMYIAQLIYAAAFLKTANGADLDDQALPFTPRGGAKYAAGYVTYSRSTAAPSDYIIASGSFVVTDPDPITGIVKQYYTTESKYIKTGYTTHYSGAISIIYVGGGGACTLTIAANTLSTTCATPAHSIGPLDLTASAYDSLDKLIGYINAFGGGGLYTVAILAAGSYSIPPAAAALFPGSQGTEQNIWLVNYAAIDITVLKNLVREDPDPVVADSAGPDLNVSAGLITTMKTAVSGAETVTNKWALQGGSDIESDAAYRNRAQTIIPTLAIGVRDQYVQWAIASNPDTVLRGFVIPINRGSGTLDVLIIATSGIATPTLITSVKAYIQTKMPPLVDMDVITIAFVTITVTGSVVLKQGYDTTIVGANIRTALDNLMSYVTYPFDEDLTVAKIIDAILSVDGVYNVTLSAPAATTVIAANQMPVLGALTLTYSYLP